MHRILTSCAIVAAAVLGSPAFAAIETNSTPGFAADAAQPQQARVNDPNEIICKNSTHETGSSLLRRRVCMTRIEWQQQEVNNRQEITDLQQRSLALPPKQ